MLRPVDEVLLLNAKYRVLSKASTLAVKLAKEAFFGDNVLVRCTVAGSREFPGLPHKEMQELKGVMLRQFPQFSPLKGPRVLSSICLPFEGFKGMDASSPLKGPRVWSSICPSPLKGLRAMCLPFEAMRLTCLLPFKGF